MEQLNPDLPHRTEANHEQEPRFLEPLPADPEEIWQALMRGLPGITEFNPWVADVGLKKEVSLLFDLWKDTTIPQGIRDRSLLFMLGNKETATQLGPDNHRIFAPVTYARMISDETDTETREDLQTWIDEVLEAMDNPVLDGAALYILTTKAFYNGEITEDRLHKRLSGIDVRQAQRDIDKQQEYPRENRLPIIEDILIHQDAPHLKDWALAILKTLIHQKVDPTLSVPEWLENTSNWELAHLCKNLLVTAISDKQDGDFKDLWPQFMLLKSVSSEKIQFSTFGVYFAGKALELTDDLQTKTEIVDFALSGADAERLKEYPWITEAFIAIAKESDDADLLERVIVHYRAAQDKSAAHARQQAEAEREYAKRMRKAAEITSARQQAAEIALSGIRRLRSESLEQ